MEEEHKTTVMHSFAAEGSAYAFDSRLQLEQMRRQTLVSQIA